MQDTKVDREDELIESIVEKGVRSLVGDFYEMFKVSNAMICGGAILSIITNKEVNDVDVYFRDKESLSLFLSGAFSGEFGFLNIISATEKSAMLFCAQSKVLFNLIVFEFFDSPDAVFEKFDFSVVMASYDFKYSSFVKDKNFYKDVMARRIIFNPKTSFPLISAVRVEKYKSRGYEISLKEFYKVLISVSGLNINSWEGLKSHISGMYGNNVDEVFKDFVSLDYSPELAIEALDKIVPSEKQGLLDFSESKSMSVKDLLDKLEDKLEPEMLEFYNTLDSKGFWFSESQNSEWLDYKEGGCYKWE